MHTSLCAFQQKIWIKKEHCHLPKMRVLLVSVKCRVPRRLTHLFGNPAILFSSGPVALRRRITPVLPVRRTFYYFVSNVPKKSQHFLWAFFWGGVTFPPSKAVRSRRLSVTVHVTGGSARTARPGGPTRSGGSGQPACRMPGAAPSGRGCSNIRPLRGRRPPLGPLLPSGAAR